MNLDPAIKERIYTKTHDAIDNLREAAAAYDRSFVLDLRTRRRKAVSMAGEITNLVKSAKNHTPLLQQVGVLDSLSISDVALSWREPYNHNLPLADITASAKAIAANNPSSSLLS